MQEFDKNRVFFLSDTHYGHGNIIKFCNRPVTEIKEMNQKLVDAWNSKVGDDDVVFFLGDFSFKMSANATEHILRSLKGTKVFVLGNHDQALIKVLQREPLLASTVKNMMNIKIIDKEDVEGEEQVIALCHYPMRAWYRSRKGSWQLFGHEHGEFNNMSLPNQIDVGVDSLYHTYGLPFGEPVSYEEVKELIIKNHLKAGR